MSIESNKLMNLADGKVLYDDLRKRVDGKALAIIGEASGAIASFSDGADGMPLQDCVVEINPVQSGTGDPSPSNIRPISGWTGANVSRTGKNLLDKTKLTAGKYVNGSGGLSNSSNFNATDYIYIHGAEKLTTKSTGNAGSTYIAFYDREKNVGDRILQLNGQTIDVPDGAYYIRFGVHNNNLNTARIEIGSTASDYTPYHGTTYPITWESEAGTVYGGSLDVTTGTLTVTDANIASYNGETLPSTWISDRDVYAEGTTPTTGAQVVYKLATPIVYQLTPTEITTLLGTNNIWADTGDTTVLYPADTKAYVDGSIPSVPVTDVQINGTSVVSNGVVNIPLADSSNFGVVKINGNYGIQKNSNNLAVLNKANASEIKTGSNDYKPIVPGNQDSAVFYGLAKIAGDTSQAISTNAAGIYTDEAKNAIQVMLGVPSTTTLSGKADKVSSATNGNFAALDTNGNLIDSGHKHSDYITSVPVTDIQINNTSIINNGVANIPYASSSVFGLVKIGTGLTIASDNTIRLSSASDAQIKAGTEANRAIVPSTQHRSIFYGLAKLAGTDMSGSSNAVGTYTDAAKGAIQSMLGINSLLSHVQATATADQLYSIGDIFCYNGKLYRATATIATSTTITPGSNCIETTIIDELNNRTIQPASGVSF